MTFDMTTGISLIVYGLLLFAGVACWHVHQRRQQRHADSQERQRWADDLHRLSQADPRFASVVDRDGRSTYAGGYYDPQVRAERRARLGLPFGRNHGCSDEDLAEQRKARAEQAAKVDQYNPRSGEAIVFGQTKDFDLFLS